MLRPLRGIDQSPAEYDRMARDASHRQWAVAGLTDTYRWLARLGAVPALVGIALGLVGRNASRQRRLASVLGLVLLAGAASRIAALTMVDATAFPASAGHYILPATAFLVGFLVTGWWILAGVVTDLRRAGSVDPPRGTEHVEAERDRDDGLDASAPRDARLVPH